MTTPAEDPRDGEAAQLEALRHGYLMDDVSAPPAGDRAQPTQELREAIARWEFARRAPARYWGSGALYGEEADARSAADELLALPEVAALLDAQAAVSRVEALAARHGCGEVGNMMGGYDCAYCEEPWLYLSGSWGCDEFRSLRAALDGTT